MRTKVSVGLSKKAGLPNYGSLGASCFVEMELDAKILEGDLESFRLQVTRAYAACRDSVEAELEQRSETGINSNGTIEAMNGFL